MQSQRVQRESTWFERADDVAARQGVRTGHGSADVVASFDNVLTTDQKGAVAELAIARQAAELGIGVWAAYTVERYDLIFDRRLRRVLRGHQ
jgi:hypothetical protein